MRQTASSIVQQRQFKGLRQTGCLRQTWQDGVKQDVKFCYVTRGFTALEVVRRCAV